MAVILRPPERGEAKILRSNFDDFDFGSGAVIIREEKRDRSVPE